MLLMFLTIHRVIKSFDFYIIEVDRTINRFYSYLIIL